MSNVGAVRVVLILLLVGMAVSCSSPGPLASSPDLPEWVYHSTWSEDVHLASWPEAKIRGLAIGFVQPADRTTPPYQRPSTHLFTVEDGEPFTTLLILAIGQDKPFPVLVSVFLDYEQVAFSLDNKQGLLHYLMIEPGVDMQIEFSGRRPGEKLFEELLTSEEGTVATKHKKIFVARKVGISDEKLVPLVDEIVAEARNGQDEVYIRHLLTELIPTNMFAEIPNGAPVLQ